MCGVAAMIPLAAYEPEAGLGSKHRELASMLVLAAALVLLVVLAG
jgi:hypothetical protein